MRAGIGFMMVSLWGCTYFGGTYENSSTTPARTKTYDTRNGVTHDNSDSYRKYMQEPPRRTGSNESQQT